MDAAKRALARIWATWKKVGHAITATLNFVLLILAYILAIGPVAIALRLTGRDILDKKWSPSSPPVSWWLPREPISDDPERYQRQF